MVVSAFTLTFLSLATLVVAFAPILLYRRLRKPLALRSRDTVAGIAVFALFAMVLERGLNDFVLHQNPATAQWLSSPLSFVVYGAIAAGVFEETGRYIAMRLLWKRRVEAPRHVDPADAARTARAQGVPAKRIRRTEQDEAVQKVSPALAQEGAAIGYGIGHGGAEAWLVGVFVQVQWIVFAVAENRGQLDAMLGNVPADSLMRLHLILASLTPQMAGIFLIERLAALTFQIGLSVLMWRGVRAGSRTILPIAIVAHAIVDVPAALFQAHVLPLYAVDACYALAALVVGTLLVRHYRRIARDETRVRAN